MTPQPQPAQAKQNKRKFSTREITAPSVKAEIFERWDRSRIREISQVMRIKAERIEDVMREGNRQLRAAGAVVSFRTRVDGFGKPMKREVIAMPTRARGSSMIIALVIFVYSLLYVWALCRAAARRAAVMRIFELVSKPGDPVLVEPLWIVLYSEFVPGRTRVAECFSSLAGAELFCHLVLREIACPTREIESFFYTKAERLADPTLTTEQIAEIYLGAQLEAQRA